MQTSGGVELMACDRATPGSPSRGWSLWVAVFALVCLSLCRAFAANEEASRPNIIFILADDYGIPGVSCYGGKYKTPNLDSLAGGGIRFERCFSAPLCAPSRALCMTGRYAFRTGVSDNGAGSNAHPQKEVSLARTLKGAGYATAVAGKWRQLSYFETKEDGQAWGFDEFMIWGVNKQGSGDDRYWTPAYNRNGTPLTGGEDKYGPDLLHQFVVDFIRRHRHRPFFVYYPLPLIHGPILKTPDTKPGVAAREQLYADNIAYLDKLVGQLAAELDELKLREKTLIVFTGDNGSVGEHTIRGRVVDGHKGTLKEGGSRVPLIANWPGTTPVGKIVHDLVDFSDFYATFAELAKAKLPEGVKLDSRSFAPQLRGQPGNPRQWIYIQLGNRWYVRNDRWKLDQDGQLFDMQDAPFAEKPVSSDSADAAVRAAREQLQSALNQLDPRRGESAGPERKAAKKAKKRAQRARN